MLRRTLLRSVAAAIATVPIGKSATASADEIPGVTATEIKIGNTAPYTGPLASVNHMPDADVSDGGHAIGYGLSLMLMQVLKQCGDDFSRENIMKQAAICTTSKCPYCCRASR